MRADVDNGQVDLGSNFVAMVQSAYCMVPVLRGSRLCKGVGVTLIPKLENGDPRKVNGETIIRLPSRPTGPRLKSVFYGQVDLPSSGISPI